MNNLSIAMIFLAMGITIGTTMAVSMYKFVQSVDDYLLLTPT